MISDWVAQKNPGEGEREQPEQEVIFLNCIIHQEALCKSVLQFDHLVKPVVKLNFQARVLQYRQFIKFHE